jgi:ubiquinone/menaquinone biosynthesis C-methylase UbiE
MRHTLFSIKTVVLLSFVIILLAISVLSCTNHQKQHTAEQQTSEKHSPATQQRFNDIDYWVKMFEDPERDKWQKPAEVVKIMDLKSGDIVTDIGAGTGYITRHLAVAVGPEGKAIGLDIEQSMVDYMNEDAEKLGLKNYTAKVVKTDDPALEPHSVDVIFLCNTYHHIKNRAAYFKNVSKSLKPGGRVISVDFYKNIDFGPPRDHKIAKETVIQEMQKAGYSLYKDVEFLQYQYYLEFTPEAT